MKIIKFGFYSVLVSAVLLLASCGGKVNHAFATAKTDDLIYTGAMADSVYGYAVGEDGLAFYTQDGGKNWQRSQNKCAPLFSLSPINETVCFATGEHKTFLKTTDFLDDKDRAVVKSDGSYTYLMPDIAYHLIKLSRGYDQLIDVLGADHHGYINRMKSALMMQGYQKDTLEVELVQVVRLIKDGEEVKMSKRLGNATTINELIDKVGVDAARYFFVQRALDSHLDFDIELATKQTNDNPVYYAQYAHARLSSVLESAADLKIDENAPMLKEESETELLKKLIEFPHIIEVSAEKRAPHVVATYIQELAANIHSFYTNCRLIDRGNLDVTASRLALAKAAKIVMKNALGVLGVDAPNKM